MNERNPMNDRLCLDCEAFGPYKSYGGVKDYCADCKIFNPLYGSRTKFLARRRKKRFWALYWQAYFCSLVIQWTGLAIEFIPSWRNEFWAFGLGMWFSGLTMMIYIAAVGYIIMEDEKYE